MVLQNMFSALSFLHYRKDDDFVDRLSYFYTSSFLTMMAVLVSFKQVSDRSSFDLIACFQFGGRPLECWVPAQFTASWEAYTEMYCWAKNTCKFNHLVLMKSLFRLHSIWGGDSCGHGRPWISTNQLLSMGETYTPSLIISLFRCHFFF
jgi:hypothetical protein